MEDKCPYCEAELAEFDDCSYKHVYKCGTIIGAIQSYKFQDNDCLRRQCDQLQARLKEAEMLLDEYYCETNGLSTRERTRDFLGGDAS